MSVDVVPKKLKLNNRPTVHILTLMVAFRMIQFMMSPLKWRTIKKLGVYLGPSLKPSLNI